MRFRNLSSWLAWLETLHPKSIDLGLERVKQAAKRLQLLPFPVFTITVGGTNGKGSCIALLESILLAAGCRVGAYTSPHLLRFNERIRIQGVECSDASICTALQVIDAARGDIPLTYFEFTTLAALWLFQQAALDIVLLEVGLGGRLDAVNCIDANIVIISSIALDHTEWLGNTREAIGYEKAGIMRAGKPAIYGEKDRPKSIHTHAVAIDAPLLCLGQDFNFRQLNAAWSWWNKKERWENLPNPAVDLQNAASVLQALTFLPARLKVDRAAIEQGLKKIRLPGRWQVLPGKPVRILDVAHNPAAAEKLSQRLQQEHIHGRTLAVVAMLADKDSYHTLATVQQYVDAWYVASLNVPRGADCNRLVDELKELGAMTVTAFTNVEAAYQQALIDAQKEDRIIVFGSFYTVASVLQYKD